MRLGKITKRLGAVVLAVIVLDLVAGVATVALGAAWLKR
jgi:hypothetical protein